MVESDVAADNTENTVNPEEDAPASLVMRLAAIRKEAYGIGKDNIKMKSKTGAEYTIKGHTFEAILAEIRPLLDRHGVWLESHLLEKTYDGNRCDIDVRFILESVDNPADFREYKWAGAGTDASDKSFAKAGTNALKEFLKKTFLITDRADASEEEDRVEHVGKGAASAADLERAKEEKRSSLEQWARALRSALTNAQDLDSVKIIERDNKTQLNSPDLPEVTRDFLNDLIASRKASLTLSDVAKDDQAS